MKFGCSIGIFVISANLICRSTDISKCFRESLRLRDNESRLYNNSTYVSQQFPLLPEFDPEFARPIVFEILFDSIKLFLLLLLLLFLFLLLEFLRFVLASLTRLFTSELGTNIPWNTDAIFTELPMEHCPVIHNHVIMNVQ